MPTVEPMPGEDLGELAAALLAVAPNPRDVVFVYGDNVFAVTDEVADRYLASLLPQEEPEAAPAPAKKAAAPKATKKKEG